VKQCYICGVEGNTREHVPPLSFFPKGFRTDLWTVRSCEEHNIGHSKDVEYVRNVVVSQRNCKGTAHELAQSAAFRSFERSAALFFQTFQRARSTVIEGEEIALFQLELPRFERVMKAIAWGIYSRETGKTYEGDWRIFSPTLLLTDDLQGVPTTWYSFRKLISALPFTPTATPEPTVFKFGRHVFNDTFHVAYAFEFYGGFHVYAWSA